MITYNIYANDTLNDKSELATTLSANSIDDLSDKYGLSLFEQDGNIISQLDKSEIDQFFSANNIDFTTEQYDEIYLHVEAA